MEHTILKIKMSLDDFKKFCLENEDIEITEEQFEKWIEIFTYDNETFYDKLYEMMGDDMREKLEDGDLDESDEEEEEIENPEDVEDPIADAMEEARERGEHTFDVIFK